MMMDHIQIHCNHCFVVDEKDFKIKFHITSCRHILCETCLAEKCPVCGRTPKTEKIERFMPADAATFLMDPMKHFIQLQNILKFGLDQETSLCTHVLEEVPKYIDETMKRSSKLEKLNAGLLDRIDIENRKISQCDAFITYEEKKKSGGFVMRPFPRRPVIDSFDSFSFFEDIDLNSTTNSNKSKANTSQQKILSFDSMIFNNTAGSNFSFF